MNESIIYGGNVGIPMQIRRIAYHHQIFIYSCAVVKRWEPRRARHAYNLQSRSQLLPPLQYNEDDKAREEKEREREKKEERKRNKASFN